ncbi:SGNH/GDSL hydrolase family protein [Leptospira sp. GIMC2001]|uniref:SGNH/GDSL hydrolase family protein n=1 Tax=Leptospira sp. GIMC2001 TaxID=1513297 RepID=UPI00234B01EE|nr:SGNH/GDSL hydrolase family protein [Leptospira sp. GIMC2001]WCL49594.1 SGNH/GDSL hydrolase family protein [Leptospira sp. GIMC2001]
MGDSITAGDYLEEKDTFVRQVEQLSINSKERLETINTGIAGISLQTELAILIETGLSTKPDDVVLGFYLNDFAPSLGLKVLKIPIFLQNSYLAQYLVKAISLVKILWFNQEEEESIVRYANYSQWFDELKDKYPIADGDPKNNKLAFHKLIIENERDWGMAWSDKAWRSSEPLFQELYRLSKVHNFKLYFIIFPVKQQVQAEFLEDYPQQKLKKVAQQYGIPVLDLLPVLRDDLQKNNIDIFYDQCHHDARGKRIIAEHVLNFLQTK